MSLTRIIVWDAAQRAQQLAAFVNSSSGRVALVDAALQIRIQTTFSRFWQERLVSLEEPDAPLVRDLLLKPHFFLQSLRRVEHEALPSTQAALLAEAMSLFDISDALLFRKLSSLSNGELRRLLVARAFMEAPDILVLDDPLGGLDPRHRRAMEESIRLLGERDFQVVLGLPEDESSADSPFILKPIHNPAPAIGIELVHLDCIQIAFGDVTILNDFSWSIHQGEHWLLQGANGSGKSSLLSFLTADHPQIYRNRVRLLGLSPGQGLSIWEHKRQVGFCSPELHHQWNDNGSLLSIVGSGFLNPRESPRPLLWEERAHALTLLHALELDPLASFTSIAYPAQRLVLVMRALVRYPRLLILDEPDQGLDSHWRRRLWDLLDLQLSNGQTTLILATHHATNFPRSISHFMTLAN